MKFYIITNYLNMLPQRTHETDSLDLSNLQKVLNERFECIILSIDELSNNILNREIIINNNFFWLCSSQIEPFKHAILDVAYEIQSQGGILVPKYDFYLSHENKYYQEFYKKRCNIETPNAILITTSLSKPEVKNFPVVSKSYSGFGSNGVSLIKNKEELVKKIEKYMFSFISYNIVPYELIKRLIKIKIKYKNKYPKKIGRVVLQDLIPDLKYDWKLLVFNNNIFALKRYTRDNDFRASGSGKFDYDCRPSNELLLFAYNTRKKLDVPFVSLDIVECGLNKFSVIEFQAVHFGLTTALNCNKYYTILEDSSIHVNKEKMSNIESFFSNSIIEYIKN
ncbi:ATP-grasp domain-containing protein [Xenorhabdus szentirmaii]|uniref:hypothetical protein n=1 Tax=Xenorhabdus szentirmaii TaxID=290112 RepID=UPI000C043E12|nr:MULTISPECIES: hypothetical protein [Xenorhabdus]MBD2781299.1 hypothetical protein [Xenorhabdus sp. 38]